MLYEQVSERLGSFTKMNIYQFRFFCDKGLRVPIEKNLPKSNPSHFCRCGAVIRAEIDGDGPYLRFSSRSESHLAARKRG